MSEYNVLERSKNRASAKKQRGKRLTKLIYSKKFQQHTIIDLELAKSWRVHAEVV